LPSHLKRGESDIDPIKVVDDVQDEQKRQQPPRKLGENLRANVSSSEQLHEISPRTAIFENRLSDSSRGI
jgi:hypothetical protein